MDAAALPSIPLLVINVEDLQGALQNLPINSPAQHNLTKGCEASFAAELSVWL